VRGFLLDTHIWWWYLTESENLNRGLRSKIDSAQTDCWFSPVSVWELSLLTARRRIEIPHPLRPWIAKALERFPVKEAPVNTEVALLSREVALSTQDPADRFIAATAIVYELTLMTVDRHLTSSKQVKTISR
jgi:PIN domain nuclease of toxin-antitoxin system